MWDGELHVLIGLVEAKFQMPMLYIYIYILLVNCQWSLDQVDSPTVKEKKKLRIESNNVLMYELTNVILVSFITSEKRLFKTCWFKCLGLAD